MTAGRNPAAGAPGSPRPASTVVLLRPGIGGPEVLLTHRPRTMAFGPGLHVFPGGAVDDDDGDGLLAGRSALDDRACAAAWSGDLLPVAALAHAIAAVRELYEEAGVLLARHRDATPVDPAVAADAAAAGEPLAGLVERLDLVLGTDLLVPLSRWVTPPSPGVARRFDARFFVAGMPVGASLVVDGREVAGHAWCTPAEALRSYAAGVIDLWPPTSATLRQLVAASGPGEVRERLSPLNPARSPVAERIAGPLARVRLDRAGGIPGASVDAWLVGERRVVVVDPGDPGDDALEAILAATVGSGRTISAVVVTSGAPDHTAGAVGLALVADVPLLASRRAAALVGDPCEVVDDGSVIDAGDVPLRMRAVPDAPDGDVLLEAPAVDAVLTGDLGGAGPSRAIPLPGSGAARDRGEALLAGIGGRRLPAHAGED